MSRRWTVAVLAIVGLVLLLMGVGPARALRSDAGLNGRILIWHTWSETEQAALAQVLASFEDLHPGVSVRTQRFESQTEMVTQFDLAARSGLGPDMVILASSQVRALARNGTLAPLDGQFSEDILARFMPSTLEMLTPEGELVGLPLSLDTQALYVNRALVDQPVNTLEGLLEQASSGQTVLMPISFYDAFWGVQAFGGRLFDDGGRVILDQGGFANWLAWLRAARDAPGVIQDSNREVLLQRFLDGQAGYYVGYATELTRVVDALGLENLSVLTLPAGPVGPAGPFLSTRSLVFSRVSSENQHAIAFELARFMTNSEQGARLMRLARHVPANTRVRINPRLNPMSSAFSAQARNAVPVPGRSEYEAVARLGNEAYSRALEGGEPPADVAVAFTAAVNEANGFAAATGQAIACTGLGTVRLVHTWESQAEHEALLELAERFRTVCPLIIVQVDQVDSSQVKRLMMQGEQTQTTFALVNQATLRELVEAPNVIGNLSGLATAETLQKFMPTALDALRVNGNLYGIPLNVNVDVLYFNRNLVSSPAQDVDELRTQAQSGVPITLDTRFMRAFWGVGAFGGALFDAEYRVLLDQGGFSDWLAWLRESRDTYGIVLSTDGDSMRERFLAGESAYYVGGPLVMAELRDALGDSNLGVALLPSGTGGDARPFSHARGFVIRDGVSEQQASLALAFIRWATDPDAQQFLMDTIQKVPAHGAVGTGAQNEIAVFIEQFRASQIVPNTAAWRAVEQLGGDAYEAVLAQGVDPVAAAAAVTTAINEVNGIAPLTPTPTPEPAVTETPAPAEDVDNGDDPGGDGGDESSQLPMSGAEEGASN